MGFCPQASPTEDIPCPLSRPLWGPKTPLTLKAPTERKLPPPAPLGVAGASLDGQQMEQLPSLSSLPGLPSQTKTRKEWGRWASGQASPRTHKGRNFPQRKSPGPLPYRTVPLGPRATKERRNVGLCPAPQGAHPCPRPSVRSPAVSSLLLVQAGGCQKSHHPGPLDMTLRFCQTQTHRGSAQPPGPCVLELSSCQLWVRGSNSNSGRLEAKSQFLHL